MHAARAFEVDGTEVLVEGAGGGTVLMIHGWPDTRSLWDGLVARLSPRWRCVRFTLPGSEPPGERRPGARRVWPLDAMLAHIGAIVDAASPGAPVTLVLHDWGAFYGYQYAMRHPDRVARIVGVDIGDTTSGEWLRSLSVRSKAAIAAYQLTLAAAWRMPAALGDRVTRRMARLLRAPGPIGSIGARMNHPYVAQWTGGFRRAVRVEPNCPMLYVYGTRKPFLFHSPGWAERLAARPGSAVHGLRAGHWVMRDRAEEFERLVGDWLAGG